MVANDRLLRRQPTPESLQAAAAARLPLPPTAEQGGILAYIHFSGAGLVAHWPAVHMWAGKDGLHRLIELAGEEPGACGGCLAVRSRRLRATLPLLQLLWQLYNMSPCPVASSAVQARPAPAASVSCCRWCPGGGHGEPSCRWALGDW